MTKLKSFTMMFAIAMTIVSCSDDTVAVSGVSHYSKEITVVDSKE